jgi:hypothetical protein
MLCSAHQAWYLQAVDNHPGQELNLQASHAWHMQPAKRRVASKGERSFGVPLLSARFWLGEILACLTPCCRTNTWPLLRLVATRFTAATGALELTALGAHVWLDMRVWHTRRAEVLDGLAAVLGASEEDTVGACRRSQRQVVKRYALPTSLQ